MKTFSAFAAVAITLLGLAVVLGAMETLEVEPTDPTQTPLPLPPEPVPDGIDTTDLAQGQALDFSAALSHGKLPSASFDEIYVDLQVKAGELRPETRAPLNVALVIDRSGSMRGEPMQKAKEAARTFVDALDERDRIALITFDNTSKIEVGSTPVDASGQRRLHEAIDGIYAGGTTNISGGLLDGFNQVKGHRDPEMLNRVVLMTDGIPNVGITDTEGLSAKTAGIRQQGITVSTLGFGVQYDASLMASMALEGAGNFRHVADAADLELAFSDEIEDLQSTVASGVKIDIRPAEGVEIADIYGFSGDPINGGKQISLGELHTDDRRSAVVELRVDKAAVGEVRELLDVRGHYVDRITGDSAGAALAIDAPTVASQAQVRASIDSDVIARVDELRTQESIQEAIDMYSRGDQAGAQQRLERERQRVDVVRQQYDIDEDSEKARRVDDRLQRVGSTVKDFLPSSQGARNRVAEESVQSVEVMRGQ